jgi:hypothetical protein
VNHLNKNNHNNHTTEEDEEYEYYDEEENFSFNSEEEFKGLGELKLREKYGMLKKKYSEMGKDKDRIE